MHTNESNINYMMLYQEHYSFTDSDWEDEAADSGLIIFFLFCLYWEPLDLPFPLRAV